MAYDPGAIEATLAAAAGSNAALIDELRDAFAESAHRALRAITSAQTDADWHAATQRLRGLAASFGAVRLMALAEEASQAPCGDGRILQRLRRAVSRF